MTLNPDFTLVKLCDKHGIPRVYQKAAFNKGRQTYQLVCTECRRERFRNGVLEKYGSWYGKKQAAKQKHPEKERARQAVQNRVYRGVIAKKPCAKCGSTEDIHAHHEDYSKPLDVTWLCNGCHHAVHTRLGA